jgi:hypothetical protein
MVSASVEMPTELSLNMLMLINLSVLQRVMVRKMLIFMEMDGEMLFSVTTSIQHLNQKLHHYQNQNLNNQQSPQDPRNLLNP